MKKIGFYSNQLSLRGTEVALYDYAHYNETILNNYSEIFTLPNTDLTALNKFSNRFKVTIASFSKIEKYLISNNFDFLYVIKSGNIDGVVSYKVPTIVHCVFPYNEPHGYKYIYVSEWLCDVFNYDYKDHLLPHICKKPHNTKETLKNKLNLLESDVIFGFHGGSFEFSIPFVHEVVKELDKTNKNIKFIFLNVSKFTDSDNCFFIKGTSDNEFKQKFINTCDALLHARYSGDTFGLSVAEFSLSNKPTIAYKYPEASGHIDILKDKGIYYENKLEFLNILINFKSIKKQNNYHEPYLKYNPLRVMNIFNYFLNN